MCNNKYYIINIIYLHKDWKYSILWSDIFYSFKITKKSIFLKISQLSTILTRLNHNQSNKHDIYNTIKLKICNYNKNKENR